MSFTFDISNEKIFKVKGNCLFKHIDFFQHENENFAFTKKLLKHTKVLDTDGKIIFACPKNTAIRQQKI